VSPASTSNDAGGRFTKSEMPAARLRANPPLLVQVGDQLLFYAASQRPGLPLLPRGIPGDRSFLSARSFRGSTLVAVALAWSLYRRAGMG
jgi:hypothetical protein